MSGRLVISRHKSWHVWNNDNRERVMRDERVHREKIEKVEKEQKIKLQQQQREALLNEAASKQLSEPLSHVNLFETVETELFGQAENAEYKRERDDKEKKRLKREGIAPWALAEGSDIKPWYSKAPDRPSAESRRGSGDGNAVTSSSNPFHTLLAAPCTATTYNTDDVTKHSLDPMHMFMPSNHETALDFSVAESKEVGTRKENNDVIEVRRTKLNQQSRHRDRGLDNVRDRGRSNEESKNSKNRIKPHILAIRDIPRDPGEEPTQLIAATIAQAHESKGMASSDPGDVINNEFLAQLRRRRLERERVERHRAAVLLAEVDIYGSRRNSTMNQGEQQPGVDREKRLSLHWMEREGYHQQYHPTISRKR